MDNNINNKLGAIPLSSDILTKANIGLWAFELDEGLPPRMYVDEAMLSLIGLKQQVSPEETYHAWYDHIDEGSYDLVAESVEKMTAGEHAEVQYPWHHPDGRTWIVRCGGVRNYAYTNGIRIEGTHQNVTALLHFDEEERKQAKITENQFKISKFRADSLAYIADNDPDLEKGLVFFGERILELSDCDQVIFRELGGNRYVFNAPGIVDIPQEICSDCPFAKFTGEKYGEDGIVLMNDCSRGFCGIMTHPDCPAKSSFMQRIYSDGELVGLLTVHYLNDYHIFSDESISLMKSVAKYFGLLIGRINEKKAQTARIEAESANKAKTAFLFNMSHDIRTPMNAIIGYTAMAKNHANDETKVRDYLEKINISGQQLLSLINQILEMSRIESGKIVLKLEPTDVIESAHNMQTMSGSDVASKGLIYTLHIKDIEHRKVLTDISRMNQIFVNIIGNAIKYTPEGGKIDYTVEEKPSDKPGLSYYVFTVADTGIGMSEEFLGHIFDEFSRENTSTVSNIQGTGLGMSIVKRLIDLMNGKIEIRSKQGVGTTITVSIPMEWNENVDEEAADTKQTSEQHISIQGTRVLLVEDNEMNREIATEILEDNDVIVDIAENGKVAVEKVEEASSNTYDLILMDIQMPIMNGYEATKKIRALTNGLQNIPIIAMTANAFEEDRQNAFEAGMNEHIAKPIDIEKLKAVLAKFI